MKEHNQLAIPLLDWLLSLLLLPMLLTVDMLLFGSCAWAEDGGLCYQNIGCL